MFLSVAAAAGFLPCPPSSPGGLLPGARPTLEAPDHRALNGTLPPDSGPPPTDEHVATKNFVLRLPHGTIRYRAAAGTLTLTDQGYQSASVFYTAYTTRLSAHHPRPITFVFNGGPWVSSMWLRAGSFGPARVRAPQPGETGGSAGVLAPNPATLLTRSDLVVIDAPVTGLSRPVANDGANLVGVDCDVDVFARFIRRYLTKYHRTMAPVFIMGESYGTFRAAILSRVLTAVRPRIALRGVILIGTFLNRDDIREVAGAERYYVNFLPSYAAAAWYHGKVAGKPSLGSWLDQATRFAEGPYASALRSYDTLTPSQIDAVSERISHFTGLPAPLVKSAKLRVGAGAFRAAIGHGGLILGRIDARYIGAASGDPADLATAPAFLAANNEQIFSQLKYRTPVSFWPINGETALEWTPTHLTPAGSTENLPDAADDLIAAMKSDPKLRVISLNGVYDLATPFGGAEHDLAKVTSDGSLRRRLSIERFEAGHMVYADEVAFPIVTRRLKRFYREALGH